MWRCSYSQKVIFKHLVTVSELEEVYLVFDYQYDVTSILAVGTANSICIIFLWIFQHYVNPLLNTHHLFHTFFCQLAMIASKRKKLTNP
jgi:hypothetical protein